MWETSDEICFRAWSMPPKLVLGCRHSANQMTWKPRSLQLNRKRQKILKEKVTFISSFELETCDYTHILLPFMPTHKLAELGICESSYDAFVVLSTSQRVQRGKCQPHAVPRGCGQGWHLPWQQSQQWGRLGLLLFVLSHPQIYLVSKLSPWCSGKGSIFSSLAPDC